jgi:hypothetical protein
MSIKFERLALLRRATEFSIYNSVLVGWRDGIQLKDTLSQRAAIDSRLEIRNTSIAVPRNMLTLSSSPSTGNIPGFDVVAWYTTGGWGNMGNTPRQSLDVGLTSAAFNLDATNNPVPGPTSELATAGTSYSGRLAGDAFFTNVSYRGAFDPSLPMSQQWTAGWTNFDPQNYDPEAAYTTGVSVALGWNMVSLPVANPSPDDSVKHIFVNLHPQVQFAYAFAGNYVVRHVLENGPGYWIKSSMTYSQDIVGTQRDTLTVPVATGWNMIGSITTSIDTSVAHVTPSVSGLRFPGVPFYKFTSSYVPATTIDPGLGYWVKTTQAGSFFMHSTGPAAKAGNEPVQSGRSIDQLNTLTIRDANGVSQTLYFGADASGEIPSYELPPLPPAGSFDARFTSAQGGMLVKTHPVEVSDVIEAPITIQSLAYPIMVSWKVGSSDAAYRLSYGEGAAQTLSGEGTLRIDNAEVNRLTLRIAGLGDGKPTEFALSQNYPNPFNPTTNITYALPVDSKLTLEVYNTLGQRVRTLVQGEKPAGFHTMEWNGTGNEGQQLASGVYFLKISAQGANGRKFSELRKLMLMK